MSIAAAIRGRWRPIREVLLAPRDGRRGAAIRNLHRLATNAGIPVRIVPREQIDELAGGDTHGGAIARAGARRFVELQHLLHLADAQAFLVMIDGVEDPYNFGSAVRSLYAAGATGLLLRPRNWLSATAIVARASAGASELLPTCIVDDLEATFSALGKVGLRVLIADEAADDALYDVDLRRPLVAVIGGEHRGITRSLGGEGLIRVRIPYARPEAASLGTAATAAILGFEVLRQRGSRMASRSPGGSPRSSTDAESDPRRGR